MMQRYAVMFALAVLGAVLFGMAGAASVQAATPTPMAMATPMPSMSPMPTASSAAAPMGVTEQTQLTVTYRLVLDIGPAANMMMPPASSGEVMVPMPGMPMPVMNTTDQGQPVNHHVELHIFNRVTGAAVTDTMPMITSQATGLSRSLDNVMAMYDAAVGPSDTHFGNNAYLPDGTYIFKATVGTEMATFADVAVSGGAPLPAAMAPTTMSTPSAAPAAIPCPSGEVITVAPPSGNTPTTVSVTVAPPVNLKPAKDAVAGSFHLHYFVDIDPSTMVQAGQQVPTGNPKIIHSATTTQDVGALAAGKHTVWVVLGDLSHTTCTPMVVGSVSFDVRAAAALPSSGTGVHGRSPGLPWAAALVAVLVAGVAAASGGYVLRRS